jgi:hypothetical protein
MCNKVAFSGKNVYTDIVNSWDLFVESYRCRRLFRGITGGLDSIAII